MTLTIGELAKIDIATEMCVFVRIATRTSERALAGDFNRERWLLAGDYFAPRVKDFGHLHGTALKTLVLNICQSDASCGESITEIFFMDFKTGFVRWVV